MPFGGLVRSTASRFVFPRDRDRFIRGRGILRAILGQYAHRSAAAVQFVYEPDMAARERVEDAFSEGHPAPLAFVVGSSS